MPVPPPLIRRAGIEDVDEVVRLREVMFRSMPGYQDDGEWMAACAGQLRERLGRDPDVAVVVAVDPRNPDHLIASGAGFITRRLPGPGNPGGRVGFIQSMVTEEEFRGRGVGRAVFSALMEWFAQNDIRRIALHATPDGARLYTTFGFAPGSSPEMEWRSGS